VLKKLLVLALLSCVVALSGAFYVLNQINAFLDQPFNIEQPTVVTIESGSNINRVLSQFEKDGYIQGSDFSKFVRRTHPELVNIKAGTFELQIEQTLAQALLHLINGEQHSFSITFVEGSTFKEWRAIFNQADFLMHSTKELSEEEIATSLGIEREKLEGLFLAETYHYTAGMSDLDIMRRAHKALVKTLDEAWSQKLQPLPLKNDYEALILASIIEKETGVASERERVSSVMINRLNRKMRLQTDPTVIYGMGDSYNGNIRKRDLQTPTPYNTYTINGLPPTPIAMVGKEAIFAAVNPEKSNYLYFVATGTGGHVFSKNLKDHNKAVRDYLNQLRKNKS
jgi:UPF0755 protein